MTNQADQSAPRELSEDELAWCTDQSRYGERQREALAAVALRKGIAIGRAESASDAPAEDLLREVVDVMTLIIANHPTYQHEHDAYSRACQFLCERDGVEESGDITEIAASPEMPAPRTTDEAVPEAFSCAAPFIRPFHVDPCREWCRNETACMISRRMESVPNVATQAMMKAGSHVLYHELQGRAGSMDDAHRIYRAMLRAWRVESKHVASPQPPSCGTPRTTDEAVAWQYRRRETCEAWQTLLNPSPDAEVMRRGGYEIRPLYAAPRTMATHQFQHEQEDGPRPDRVSQQRVDSEIEPDGQDHGSFGVNRQGVEGGQVGGRASVLAGCVQRGKCDVRSEDGEQHQAIAAGGGLADAPSRTMAAQPAERMRYIIEQLWMLENRDDWSAEFVAEVKAVLASPAAPVAQPKANATGDNQS